MPIKLSKAEQEFRKPLIAHIDAKAINLDRMLVNLFMLIKHNGQRPIANKSRGDVKLPSLYDRLGSFTSPRDLFAIGRCPLCLMSMKRLTSMRSRFIALASI